MSGSGLLKGLIFLLIAANVGFLGYNGFTAYKRMGFKDELKKELGNVVKIKELSQLYRSDIATVRDQKIVGVEHAKTYFANQARAAGIDPGRELKINDPKKQKASLGKNFQEQSWKIQVNKNYRTKMNRIADYCERIETEAPQFQIKEIDLAKRSEVWGKDEWEPKSITVRRITRKAKR